MTTEYWLIHHKGKLDYEELPKGIELQRILDGFGYYGVVLYDPDTDKVQCHICGKWFVRLGCHVVQKHKIPSEEYKELYELARYGMNTPSDNQQMSDFAKKIELNKGRENHRLDQYDHNNRSYRRKLTMTSLARDPKKRQQAAQTWTKNLKQDPERYEAAKQHMATMRALSYDAIRTKKKTCFAEWIARLEAETGGSWLSIREARTLTGKSKWTILQRVKAGLIAARREIQVGDERIALKREDVCKVFGVK